jgi:hypothetical protein
MGLDFQICVTRLGLEEFFMQRSLARLFLLSTLIATPPMAAPSKTPTKLDQIPEMRVSVVRSSATDCDSRCKWISAEGKIVSTTPARFRSILKTLGEEKTPIFIDSGGGDVRAAMAIGQMIRAKRLEVAVGKTDFGPDGASGEIKQAKPTEIVGSPSMQRAFCASACTLIFAAGAKRIVYPWSYVGVHEMFVPAHMATKTYRQYLIRTLHRGEEVVSKERILLKETKTSFKVATSKSPPKTYREVGAYLKQMGVSGEIVALMKTAPPEGMRWLTRSELLSTALSTEVAEYKPRASDVAAARVDGSSAFASLQPLRPAVVGSGQATPAARTRAEAFWRWRAERVSRDYWFWGGLFAVMTVFMVAPLVSRQRKLAVSSRRLDPRECFEKSDRRD